MTISPVRWERLNKSETTPIKGAGLSEGKAAFLYTAGMPEKMRSASCPTNTLETSKGTEGGNPKGQWLRVSSTSGRRGGFVNLISRSMRKASDDYQKKRRYSFPLEAAEKKSNPFQKTRNGGEGLRSCPVAWAAETSLPTPLTLERQKQDSDKTKGALALKLVKRHG